MPLPTEWFRPSAMLTKYCPDAIAPPLIMRMGPNKLIWRHTVVPFALHELVLKLMFLDFYFHELALCLIFYDV
jgi:hypothetical protein